MCMCTKTEYLTYTFTLWKLVTDMVLLLTKALVLLQSRSCCSLEYLIRYTCRYW